MKAFIFLCGAFLFVAVLANAYDNTGNKEAVSVKRHLQPVLAAALEENKDISLQNIVNVAWDLVCFATYEAKGIDVADARWIAEQGLKKEALSVTGYQIADEHYNEFRGNNYGLVFINHARQLVVGTIFDADVYMKGRESYCVTGAEAVLTYKRDKPKDINRATARYFVLERQQATQSTKGE